MAGYAELQTTTNFSFLRGGSHPQELVFTAASLSYAAIGITDRNSLAGVASEEPRYFYHVHSYARLHPEPAEMLGECEYDARFATIVGGEGVWGVQFHPEKSQEAGLRILRNFGRM